MAKSAMKARPTRSYVRKGSKLESTVAKIASDGWSSPNEFIETFFREPKFASQSFRYQEGKNYFPVTILDIMEDSIPSGEGIRAFNAAVSRKAANVMVNESTAAYRTPSLQVPATSITIPHLTTNFGLSTINILYRNVLPCLYTLLYTLLTANNDYENKTKTQKKDKFNKAEPIILVIISMLLFFRNRATNAVPLMFGIFLASCGTGRRGIDMFNHMALSVGYDAIQSALEALSKDSSVRAREYIQKSNRLWGVVYDNINFTLRPTSQRLDSATRQINATTLAVFSFPAKFTRDAYAGALSILERNRGRAKRQDLTMQDVLPSEESQSAAKKAFKYAVSTILLENCPGHLQRKRHQRKLRRFIKGQKPKIRQLSHEKTEFFPLPALDEEEASVGGTIRVVEKIFTKLLGLAVEVIDLELRLMVGDWLTIRNLRLMREERKYEFTRFLKMSWVQESAMPFHFQLNAMYALYRTHLGTAAQALLNPSSLEHQRGVTRRSKFDPKKPEYNSAKEFVFQSLTSRLLDVLIVVLKLKSYDDLKLWRPSQDAFEQAVDAIVERFTTSEAADLALQCGDELLAHSILFIRDSLFFWEFCDAVQDADVGRMWVVYDFWTLMMRGAGCHNYGNELLEMKAQFLHEFPQLLRDVVERTWLVNRWGKAGRSIPTDLYLEHNNGFLKASGALFDGTDMGAYLDLFYQNMFAALGANASIEYIQNKSSACVEVLRLFSHQISEWFGRKDFNRRHAEVSARADIGALVLDMSSHNMHRMTPNRSISSGNGKSAVRDVLTEGLDILLEKGAFEKWMNRSGDHDEEGETLEGEAVEEGEDTVGGSSHESAFASPDGRLENDTTQDPEFALDNPFSALSE